jgi:hypothetical protein
MKLKHCLILLCVIFLSCSNNSELEQKSISENRETVVKGEKSSISIVLPDGWEVIDYNDQWAAKKSCENEFCANIVYYSASGQNDLFNLIEVIESELRSIYKPDYKLLFKSPVYENPMQFSLGYTLREGNLNLLGYTFVIENKGDVHVFEMLDTYLDENKIEEMLIFSAELFSSVVIENH